MGLRDRKAAGDDEIVNRGRPCVTGRNPGVPPSTATVTSVTSRPLSRSAPSPGHVAIMTCVVPRTTIHCKTGSMAIRRQGSGCMGAMTTDFRGSFNAGARGRASGFSFIEMMLTLSVGGIVLALAVPSFDRAIADIHTRSTAQQLAGALRLARASAVTRNRPAAFMLTDATPETDAAAAVHAGNWLVKFLPSTPHLQAARGTDVILATTASARDRVTLTGPAQVCFDAQGLQMSTPDAPDGTRIPCAQPGADLGGVTSYLVSRSDATRQYKVRVWRTGRVDICDVARTHGKDLDGCA
jgi:type IV fimbrial biogenesis protein FimT